MSGIVSADAGFPSLLRSESRGVGALSGFGRPFGLARDGEERIHVVDMDLHAICRLSPDLQRAQWFADGTGWSAPVDISEGSASAAQARAPGRFNGPHSIAVGRDGRLYVVTYYAPGLHIIEDHDGAVTVSCNPIGLEGPATGHFDQTGRLLIAEYKLHAVFAVNAAGRFVGALGGGNNGFAEERAFAAGNGASEFDRPHMCKPRADGALVVADTWNYRLQLFDRDGRFVGVLGGGMSKWCDDAAATPEGRAIGAFSAPVAVSMGHDGRFVVTDWGNNRLQWFDHDGRSLAVDEHGLDRPYDARNLRPPPGHRGFPSRPFAVSRSIAMQPLVVFGASGHARVIIDAARRCGGFELIGVSDSQRSAGDVVDGLTVLGPDSKLAELRAKHSSLAGIIGIGDNGQRRAVAEAIGARARDFSFATIVHPAAVVAADVEIGAGSFLAAGAVINTGTRVGMHAVINTNAGVDHDCLVDDFGFVGPGAALAGTVRVHRNAFIGTGAAIAPNVTIGADAIVGAGAVVLQDVAPGSTVVGVPARPTGR